MRLELEDCKTKTALKHPTQAKENAELGDNVPWFNPFNITENINFKVRTQNGALMLTWNVNNAGFNT